MRNLLVAQAFEDTAQDLLFARSESGDRFRRRALAGRNGGGFPGPVSTGRDGADGFEQGAGGIVLQKYAGDTEAACDGDVDRVHARSDHEDPAAESGGLRRGEEARAGFVIEIEIEQDDIDRSAGKDGKRLSRGAAFGYGFEVRLGDEQTAQAFAEQHVIVEQGREPNPSHSPRRARPELRGRARMSSRHGPARAGARRERSA